MSMTIRINAARCDVTIPEGVFEFNPRDGVQRGAVCTAIKTHLGLSDNEAPRRRRRNRSRKNRHSTKQEAS